MWVLIRARTRKFSQAEFMADPALAMKARGYEYASQGSCHGRPIDVYDSSNLRLGSFRGIILSLLKIPSDLCNLRFTSPRRHTPHLILTCRPAYPRGGTGVHPPSHPPARPCPLPEPLALGSGESRPASAARRPQPEGQAAPAPKGGPELLGDVRADLEGVALGPHPGQAGDRPPLAPPGVPVLLEMEVERSAVPQSGSDPADPSDVPGEPALGRPAHPFGAPAPRVRRR